MYFEFQRREDLPRLAWCARIRRREARIEVLHGAGVELRNDGFFEGVWDGAFVDSDFTAATVFSGSGARISGDGVLFATATDKATPLRSLRCDDTLYLSNSTAFILSQAGDTPKIAYPWYFMEVLEHARQGVRARHKPLRTQQRNQLYLHYHCNLWVSPTLVCKRYPKNFVAAPPADYAGYVSLLRESLARTFANAIDARRIQRFTPLAPASAGYDSSAIAAIASGLGCSEAITFATRNGDPSPDSGTAIVAHLGMQCHEYDQMAYLHRDDKPEVEFLVEPPGYNVVFAAMEERLASRLWLNGYSSDTIWNRDPRKVRNDLAQFDTSNNAGGTLGEFRLRVGIQLLSVPAIGVQHAAAIARISGSREMAPWSVGGSYDKPIPRRIAEEAGIPRQLFGQEKYATSHIWLTYPERLSPATRADYLAWVATLRDRVPAPLWYWYRVNYRLLIQVHDPVMRRIRRLRRDYPWLRSILPQQRWLPLSHARQNGRSPWEMHFTFQWALERIASRYRPGGET
ncbi:MAG: hypothetical protein LJE84_05380 [Gammaproteobacteria bacterium]|nr:hypothetical protein [Gammaproteobacteria bacterium]